MTPPEQLTHDGIRRRNSIQVTGLATVLAGLGSVSKWLGEKIHFRNSSDTEELFFREHKQICALIRTRVAAAVGNVLDENEGAQAVFERVRQQSGISSPGKLVEKLVAMAEKIHMEIAGIINAESAAIDVSLEEITHTVRSLVTNALDSDGATLAQSGQADAKSDPIPSITEQI